MRRMRLSVVLWYWTDDSKSRRVFSHPPTRTSSRATMCSATYSSDLAEGHRARAIAVWLLHGTHGRCTLARGLGREILARNLSTGRSARGMLRASHGGDREREREGSPALLRTSPVVRIVCVCVCPVGGWCGPEPANQQTNQSNDVRHETDAIVRHRNGRTRAKRTVSE